MKSALKAYDDRVPADESGIRPLYRPREWKTKERAIGKQRKKNDSYKTRGDDAVIFIPGNSKIRAAEKIHRRDKSKWAQNQGNRTDRHLLKETPETIEPL